MNVKKVLPADFYYTVSAAEFRLEETLKIFHITSGSENQLPVFEESGTMIVICTQGTFSCKMLEKFGEIKAGQVLLSAIEDTFDMLFSSDFDGVVIYISEELLVNRQSLSFRSLASGEMDDTMGLVHLIESQVEKVRNVRAKIVESLLRALVISLQYPLHEGRAAENEILVMFRDWAILVSRFHYSPSSFYAARLGITTQELNRRCRKYAGMAAMEWVSEYVLLEAKDLLSKTRWRPGQVAKMLGFTNHDTFTRWFRRHTGCVPKEW